MDLSQYNNSWYNPGRGLLLRILWYFINVLFFRNPLNLSSGFKVFFLRLFGAKIDAGVILKPGINVKYPWNLEINDSSWIGEGVWLDSLTSIKIGSNCCVSQGVYFCTGNHDWTDPAFGLFVKPIKVEEGAWVGARVTILPGVIIGKYSVVTAGLTITKDTEPYMIYEGNPAVAVKRRVIGSGDS